MYVNLTHFLPILVECEDHLRENPADAVKLFTFVSFRCGGSLWFRLTRIRSLLPVAALAVKTFLASSKLSSYMVNPAPVRST